MSVASSVVSVPAGSSTDVPVTLQVLAATAGDSSTFHEVAGLVTFSPTSPAANGGVAHQTGPESAEVDAPVRSRCNTLLSARRVTERAHVTERVWTSVRRTDPAGIWRALAASNRTFCDEGQVLSVRLVVLAGGLGTRLSEVTESRPKPMVEIGGRPVLWHILKGYAAAGIHQSVIAAGYRSEVIKKYFVDYAHLSAERLRVDLGAGEIVSTGSGLAEKWVVDIVDTGELTNTGGRVGRLSAQLPEDTFCLTYGDGVSDVDIAELIAFHRSRGRLATITAVRPPARFGGLVLEGDDVVDFTEKPQIGEGWINGGFMVLERAVLDRITGDDCNLEADVLDPLAAEGQLSAFRHEGFWQCMDTLRDVRLLNSLWDDGSAPWRTW